MRLLLLGKSLLRPYHRTYALGGASYAPRWGLEPSYAFLEGYLRPWWGWRSSYAPRGSFLRPWLLPLATYAPRGLLTPQGGGGMLFTPLGGLLHPKVGVRCFYAFCYALYAPWGASTPRRGVLLPWGCKTPIHVPFVF